MSQGRRYERQSAHQSDGMDEWSAWLHSAIAKARLVLAACSIVVPWLHHENMRVSLATKVSTISSKFGPKIPRIFEASVLG